MELETLHSCVLTTGRQMLIDRGETGIVALEDVDGWLSHRYVFIVDTLGDPKKRAGIHDVRAYAGRWPNKKMIIVAHGGGTPFLLGRLEEAHPNNQSVEIFSAEELRRNITHHNLVPRHRRLTEQETKDQMGQLGLTDAKMLPSILKTDPVIRYFAWNVGNIVRIERRDLKDSGMVQEDIALRVVTST